MARVIAIGSPFNRAFYAVIAIVFLAICVEFNILVCDGLVYVFF
jgi:hypothetical protein